MAKLKDGFYKQIATTLGDNAYVLLAGGGSKVLSDFAYKSDLTNFVTGGPYLPLTGGTMTGSTTVNSSVFPAFVLNNTNSNGVESGIRFEMKGSNKGYVGYHNSYGTFLFNSTAGKYVYVNNSGYFYTQSYINVGAGNEKNASNPPYVWGVNGSDNFMRTYATSSLSVNYATSAGSATKATQDGNGNTITSYYVTLGTDQTITGKKTFSNVILFTGNDSYGIRTATNNYVRIGESSYRFYQCYVTSYYATSGFYQDSDIRLKNIVQNVEVNLDDLAKLQKVYYTWKSGVDTNKHIGMIAQEVQKLYPELVNKDEDTGYLSLAYDQLSVIALKAIDKLYAMIKDVQDENKHLKERLNQLENRIS